MQEQVGGLYNSSDLPCNQTCKPRGTEECPERSVYVFLGGWNHEASRMINTAPRS
jgi:hypothetical protein